MEIYKLLIFSIIESILLIFEIVGYSLTLY